MDKHHLADQDVENEDFDPWADTETNGYRPSVEPEGHQPGASLRNVLGEHLRELRQAAGLTQQVLAERVGISPAMLSHLEAGRRGAHKEVVAKLEVALGLEADQLADLNRRAQAAQIPEDVRIWIASHKVDFAWAGGAAELKAAGPARAPKPARSTKSGAPASGLEDRLIDYLLETQFRSALSGRFKSDDRIARLAAVVDGLGELESDDLLRVSGFIAGLKASRSDPPPAVEKPFKQ